MRVYPTVVVRLVGDTGTGFVTLKPHWGFLPNVMLFPLNRLYVCKAVVTQYCQPFSKEFI